MNHWGKVVGTLAGLATGKPWLALLGLILGHQFDRGFADRFTRFGAEISSGRLEALPDKFLRPLFETMGHLAKADGRVSEDEIRAARVLMNRLSLGPVKVRQAIGWFEAGKHPAYAMSSSLRRLRAETAKQPESRALFLRLLMEVSLAKPTLQQRERALIWAICNELEIGRVELAQLEAMLRAQRGFRRSAAGDSDARRVSAAYSTLGLDKSASNEEIKKAYRRLMNKNHPDKLVAAQPDKAAMTEAERRTREVRSAYEMLKARRSIR